MKHPRKTFLFPFLSLLLAALLLAGCGAQPSSSLPASSASLPASDSAPAVAGYGEVPDYTTFAAYAAAEPWQRAGYDLLASLLGTGNDAVPSKAELIYKEDGVPWLVVYYCSLADYLAGAGQDTTAIEVWRIEGEEASLYYQMDGDGEQATGDYTFSGALDPATGGLLFWQPLEWEDENIFYKYRAVEFDPKTGENRPLYEQTHYTALEPGLEALHTLTDDTRWTFEQMVTQRPLADDPYQYAEDTLYLLAFTSPVTFLWGQPAARAAEFFLPVYELAIPEGTPEWILPSLRYIRAHTFFEVDEAGALDETALVNRYSEITLYPPFNEGGAPLFVMSGLNDASYSTPLPHYTANGRIACLAVPHMDSEYIFWQDAAGKPLLQLVTFGSGASGSTWYTLDETGPVMLFDSEVSSASTPYYAYVGEEFYWSERLHPAEDWMGEESNRRLTALGYTLPLAEQAGATYTLPQGRGWAEMEAALVEAFYDFAEELTHDH